MEDLYHFYKKYSKYFTNENNIINNFINRPKKKDLHTSTTSSMYPNLSSSIASRRNSLNLDPVSPVRLSKLFSKQNNSNVDLSDNVVKS